MARFMIVSGRSPAVASAKGRRANRDDDDDLTKDMDDPTPEPNIQEVALPKTGWCLCHKEVSKF